MTYRIATYPGLNDEPVLLRHNDGALVILRGEGDGAVPVLIVPRVAEVARNVAYTAPDPEQEAFAARVVALLNGESHLLDALQACLAPDGGFCCTTENERKARAAIANATGQEG